MFYRGIFVSLVAALFLLLGPQPAAAYIGPGAGLSAIGTVVALLGAVSLAVVGFVWYPIKRLRNKRRKSKQAGQGTASE